MTTNPPEIPGSHDPGEAVRQMLEGLNQQIADRVKRAADEQADKTRTLQAALDDTRRQLTGTQQQLTDTRDQLTEAQRPNQPTRRRRALRASPAVAGLAGVASMTEPGQDAIHTGVDAAKWTSGELADAGQWAGGEAVDAGQWIGGEAVDAGQWIGGEATDIAGAVVETGEDIGQGIGDAAVAAGHGIGDVTQAGINGVVDTVQWAGGLAVDLARTASGFAVETWGHATDLAHSVGAWGLQYADQLAAHPGNAAVTAALGAGAVIAATPQLRQAVGRAAAAASRWGKQAVAPVVDQARDSVLGVKLIFQKMRESRPIQEQLNATGANQTETLQAANQVTAPTNAQIPTAAQATSQLSKTMAAGLGSQTPLGSVVVNKDVPVAGMKPPGDGAASTTAKQPGPGRDPHQGRG